MFHQIEILIKILLKPTSYCPFDQGRWHTSLWYAWNLRSAHLQNSCQNLLKDFSCLIFLSGCSLVGRACGQIWAAPRGRHTRTNQHELASNNECTWTCFVVLAGMVQEQPGIWLAGMDLAEICKEYAVLCKNMHKICTYIDCISQICKRYARIMSKICLNSKYAVICYKQLMCINCSQSM